MTMHPVLTITADILSILLTTLFSIVFESAKSLRKLLFPVYKDLSNDVILVTGAGGGIGRLLCLRFAKYCPNLVGWDVNKVTLDETARLVAKQGCVLKTYVCDLSCSENITATASQVLQDVGRVTVLVNNAGVVSGRNLLELTSTEIETTFKVNVLSHFSTIQAFLPTMIGTEGSDSSPNYTGDTPNATPRGHIVTVASIAGFVPGVGLSDYCASKSATLMVSDALELELADMGLQNEIHVTRICPFLVNTKMFDGCQPLRPWLFPIVDMEYCAERIVTAVRANERLVCISGRFSLFPLLKVLIPSDTLRYLYSVGGAEFLTKQLQANRRIQQHTGTNEAMK